MNLNELKDAWQQQEQTNLETKKTSEQLMHMLVEQRSTSAIGQMMNVEYVSLAGAALVLLVVVCSASFFTGSAGLLTAFMITLVLLAASLGWGWYKIRLLQGLDFGSGTVTGIAERLERFRLMIVREKLVTLIVAPVAMAALIPLAHRLVRGGSAFDHVGMYAGRLAAGYVVLVVLVVIFYRKFYFRNIELTSKHLEEIRAFRK